MNFTPFTSPLECENPPDSCVLLDGRPLKDQERQLVKITTRLGIAWMVQQCGSADVMFIMHQTKPILAYCYVFWDVDIHKWNYHIISPKSMSKASKCSHKEKSCSWFILNNQYS